MKIPLDGGFGLYGLVWLHDLHKPLMLTSALWCGSLLSHTFPRPQIFTPPVLNTPCFLHSWCWLLCSSARPSTPTSPTW